MKWNISSQSKDWHPPCNEHHIGNTPRSIMTKGTSTRPKNRDPVKFLYGNFNPGDQDKLMISYRKVDYSPIHRWGILFFS